MKNHRITVTAFLRTSAALILLRFISPCAQDLGISPANPADPRAGLINSSLSALSCGAEIITGYQKYYTNLSEDALRSGFSGFILPIPDIATLGLKARYFSSDIYKRGWYALSLAKNFADNRLGLGLDIGAYNISFDQNRFKLDDPNDPVFAQGTSKTSPTLGISGFLRPLRPLLIAFSADHLNKPNLSVADQPVTLPINIAAGILLDYKLLSPFAGFAHSKDDQEWEIGLQSRLADLFLLQAFRSVNSFGLFASLNAPVGLGQIKIGYQLSVPSGEIRKITDNSHQIVFAYAQRREPPDFQLIAEPHELSVYPDEQAVYNIRTLPKAGFKNTVAVNASTDEKLLPNLEPESLSPTDQARLTVAPKPDAQPKQYQINLTARSGKLKKTTAVKLNLKPFPKLNAEIACSVDTLVITESTEIIRRNPILPYIFFKEGSDSLDTQKYNLLKPSDDFETAFRTLSYDPEDVLAQYKNTLNVIAKRLRDRSDLKITLKGFLDGKNELNQKDLALRRAQTVARYLVQSCGVNPDQILVESGTLPDDPSTVQDAFGLEENRRVEIRSADPNSTVFSPLVLQETRLQKSPPFCRFTLSDTAAEAGLELWKIFIYTDTDTVKRFQGNSFPKEPVAWDWSVEPRGSVAVNQTYHYSLFLKDKRARTYITPKKDISVIGKETKIRREDITRLILFKFDKDKLELASPLHIAQLETIFQTLLNNPDARLIIEGHTDIIGDHDYNLRLSAARAKSAADYFIARGISPDRIQYTGFGPDRPALPNDSPEGRMLNRRVELKIQSEN